MPELKIALAQLPFRLGAFDRNAEAILQAAAQAEQQGADVVVFPELYLSGYHARDLWLRPGFIDHGERCYQQLLSASASVKTVLVFGLPRLNVSGKLMNTAVALYQGQALAEYYKYALPNDGVFDERRYFHSPQSPMLSVFTHKGWRLALLICEDIWHHQAYQHVHSGLCDCVLAPQASPFAEGKSSQRQRVIANFCQQSRLPLIYVNGHGAQDELIFDGDSQAYSASGDLLYRAPAYQDDIAVVTLAHSGLTGATTAADSANQLDLTYDGLVLAIRAYFAANKLDSALLGLSGGIDSALCAALVRDALGADKLQTYFLPYKFSSSTSLELAQAQAKLLGAGFQVLPINGMVSAMLDSLPAKVSGDSLVLQNAQARARALLLMACSNSSGALLVACSNKSEAAMGYATLYGDMAGAIAPLLDVYKTQVWQLALRRNQRGAALVPEIISRQPTAELLPGQKDSDNLPEYELLDQILQLYLDGGHSPQAIAAQGFEAKLVARVCRQVEASEYKRRQAPLSFRVSHSAFGIERRYPICKSLTTRD